MIWRTFLHGWLPALPRVRRRERLLSALGGAFALLAITLITHAFVPGSAAAIIVGSMGASAVIVFGLPTSPLGQPWSLVGGHLISAIAGVACQQLLPGSLFTPALAVGLALALMMGLRCVHPPGGATALTAVIGGPAVTALGFSFVLLPVALNVFIMLLAGLVANNLLPGRRYPAVPPSPPQHTRDPASSERGGVNTSLLEQVLADQPHLLDLGTAELEVVVRRALGLARHLDELRCADVMSRDLYTASPDEPIDDVRVRMVARQVHQVPVVRADGHFLGLIHAFDLLHALPDSPRNAGPWARPVALTAAPDTALIGLLEAVIAHAQPCLPVLAEDGRLVGLVSQSDWLAALANTQP
ncbi:HPP family protein [Andreprevotia chitinilytica]|uniref:HPP family protein n=1 Tax=Andreprevotia chitinilytica TaxID=396808 RepID=UPI00068E3FF7|nr:HPP family protein [Andreprevotia chitinilytica]